MVRDRYVERQVRKTFFRSSVEGILEEFLEDMSLPSQHLRKIFFTKELVTGRIRCLIWLKHQGRNPLTLFMKSSIYLQCVDKLPSFLDPRLLEIAHNAEALRNIFRGPSAFPKTIKLRIYVIRAINLSFESIFGACNPYLVFNIGERQEAMRGSIRQHTHNPEFFLLFERDIIFPEQSQVAISVWSEQEIYGNRQESFIGATEIDLEERWFSEKWQVLMKKNQIPMEYRKLKRLGEEQSQGTLELWVELMDIEVASEVPKFDLLASVPTEIEIRVIIWAARGLSLSNSEKILDPFIRCTLDCATYSESFPVIQQTDVHYNATIGNSTFNWRMVYPRICSPVGSCLLQIACYDFQKIGVPLFVGEVGFIPEISVHTFPSLTQNERNVNLELRKYVNNVAKTLSRLEVDSELKLVNTAVDDSSARGYIQVTAQFLAQSEATGKPAGRGRDEPNSDPRLLIPQEGRKWEDFLVSAGIRTDFRPFWFWVRCS
ncbi:putative heat shock protein DnaJ pfj4 [Cardiosporidium cionae]|uniref:Heat shock protein DnaJ pfj4 n=1 Tax=Cardiosporidium cionae TaxID=476202 RepID=A0ABQ7JFE2_9APIC|nr:putative heat shock protein DnaJ pfj4 [Cardiosporidium cionae]|eukprot:KAF8822686.1 putative heat shock protein DnaJ pfj4 [Cardiosporidium cionae]